MRHSRSTNSGHRSSPWPAAWPRLPVAGCSWLLSSTHARDKPARGLRGDERAAVLIHLTAADLPAAETVAGDAAPHVAGEPRSAERTTGGPFGHGGSGIAEKRRSGLAARPYARVTGGPGLPDTVVKRLTCAGRIRTAVHDQDGTVLDLGRSHRVVSERLYRALLLRDAGRCTHPGCANTRDLQAHHVRHWLYGGPTNLAKLIPLLVVGWEHALARADAVIYARQSQEQRRSTDEQDAGRS